MAARKLISPSVLAPSRAGGTPTLRYPFNAATVAARVAASFTFSTAATCQHPRARIHSPQREKTKANIPLVEPRRRSGPGGDPWSLSLDSCPVFMPTPDSIETRIYEHVIGKVQPMHTLLNTGVLSNEWTDEYLRLLKEAVQKFEGQDCLPRELVAAVHAASWYLNIRYDAWRSIKQAERNEQTEANLARLRPASEFLLLSSVVERAKTQRGAVNEHES